MSIAGKYLFQTYGALRSIRARFTGVVVSGDTLVIEMWKENMPGAVVLFRVSVTERGKVCINHGVAHLWEGQLETARL
jgi:multifunctional beta-oxidation protein